MWTGSNWIKEYGPAANSVVKHPCSDSDMSRRLMNCRIIIIIIIIVVVVVVVVVVFCKDRNNGYVLPLLPPSLFSARREAHAADAVAAAAACVVSRTSLENAEQLFTTHVHTHIHHGQRSSWGRSEMALACIITVRR